MVISDGDAQWWWVCLWLSTVLPCAVLDLGIGVMCRCGMIKVYLHKCVLLCIVFARHTSTYTDSPLHISCMYGQQPLNYHAPTCTRNMDAPCIMDNIPLHTLVW